MRLALATLAALALAPAAFAAGSGDATPPKPSETTTVCEEGLVFDIATQTCLPPEQSTNDAQSMIETARELAYAGRLADAGRVLDLMPDQSDPWVLTYRGFLARKSGDLAAAEGYYQAALALDPDFLLARSYMGQGYVEAGRFELARAELTEIRLRGGRGSWAETSLRLALESGKGFSY